LTDELEQGIDAELVDRQIVEFVDPEQCRFQQACQLALRAAGGLGGGQGVDDIDGAGNQCRVALEAGGVGQGDGQVGLAHADPAVQDDVAVLGEEVQEEQLLDLGAVDLLRPAPIEPVEGLDTRQAGGLQVAAHEGLVTAGRLP
jgi:hypothetical protein